MFAEAEEIAGFFQELGEESFAIDEGKAAQIVTVEVNSKRKTLTLVGTQQADPLSGKISFHSPVGAALMGHLAGEVVPVTVNKRTVTYKILEVK